MKSKYVILALILILAVLVLRPRMSFMRPEDRKEGLGRRLRQGLGLEKSKKGETPSPSVL